MAEGVSVGAGVPADLKDDGLRLDPGPNTTEWWYFDALFEDGSDACVVLNAPPNGSVRLTVSRPDGTREVENSRYRPDQFSASKERCDVRVGPHRASGDLHRYEISTTGNKVALDLAFTGIVPPWKPAPEDPTAPVTLGWLPAIPFGTAQGTITYGEQTHPVRGTAYHDHNWFNVPPGSAVDHWFWGRGSAGTYSFIFAKTYFSPALGSREGSIFMLAKGSEIIIGHLDNAITPTLGPARQGPGGRTYPEYADFDFAADDTHVHLAFRNQRFIEWISLEADTTTPTSTNGWYYRWRADLDLTVDIAGSKEVIKGEGTYELMMF